VSPGRWEGVSRQGSRGGKAVEDLQSLLNLPPAPEGSRRVPARVPLTPEMSPGGSTSGARQLGGWLRGARAVGEGWERHTTVEEQWGSRRGFSSLRGPGDAGKALWGEEGRRDLALHRQRGRRRAPRWLEGSGRSGGADMTMDEKWQRLQMEAPAPCLETRDADRNGAVGIGRDQEAAVEAEKKVSATLSDRQLDLLSSQALRGVAPGLQQGADRSNKSCTHVAAGLPQNRRQVSRVCMGSEICAATGTELSLGKCFAQEQFRMSGTMGSGLLDRKCRKGGPVGEGGGDGGLLKEQGDQGCADRPTGSSNETFTSVKEELERVSASEGYEGRAGRASEDEFVQSMHVDSKRWSADLEVSVNEAQGLVSDLGVLPGGARPESRSTVRQKRTPRSGRRGSTGLRERGSEPVPGHERPNRVTSREEPPGSARQESEESQQKSESRTERPAGGTASREGDRLLSVRERVRLLEASGAQSSSPKRRRLSSGDKCDLPPPLVAPQRSAPDVLYERGWQRTPVATPPPPGFPLSPPHVPAAQRARRPYSPLTAAAEASEAPPRSRHTPRLVTPLTTASEASEAPCTAAAPRLVTPRTDREVQELLEAMPSAALRPEPEADSPSMVFSATRGTSLATPKTNPSTIEPALLENTGGAQRYNNDTMTSHAETRSADLPGAAGVSHRPTGGPGRPLGTTRGYRRHSAAYAVPRLRLYGRGDNAVQVGHKSLQPHLLEQRSGLCLSMQSISCPSQNSCFFKQLPCFAQILTQILNADPLRACQVIPLQQRFPKLSPDRFNALWHSLLRHAHSQLLRARSSCARPSTTPNHSLNGDSRSNFPPGWVRLVSPQKPSLAAPTNRPAPRPHP
jgi:hypothetical protein